MNIFILDKDPVVAAQYLCDRHLSKMILESAQMLSSVAFRYNFEPIYKPAYKNHPCTLWAGDTYENWSWLVTHSLAMNVEKIKRTGKTHKSAEVIKFYKDNHYHPNVIGKLTPFAQAMPDTYRNEDAVIAYRSYYLEEKNTFKDGKKATWTNAVKPPWWTY